MCPRYGQIMMPNISFLGHLSGLVVGLLFAWGKLTWAVPSYEAIQELESKPFMARLRAVHGFVPCPDRDPVSAGPAQADERSTLCVAGLRALPRACRSRRLPFPGLRLVVTRCAHRAACAGLWPSKPLASLWHPYGAVRAWW